MGVYIKNMEKPKDCRTCFLLQAIKCPVATIEDLRQERINNDCPLIEIEEPNGILAHDIRKVIAFIDPHMIIATTYDEQIERAEAVKDWLLSIVGERRTE